MSLVDDYIREQRERRRSTIITTILVFIGIIAVFAYSIYDDKHRQKELYTFGGAVGVENKTNHKVTLHLFVHGEPEGSVITRTIEPMGYWVIRDSMSKQEVADFPPMQWLDSGHLVFDDTYLLRHATYPSWKIIPYDDHCIHDKSQWKYESLTVRRASRYHPALYRPLRVYYITDEDYDRALKANKRYNKIIIL